MSQSHNDDSVRCRRIIVIVPDEPGSLANVTEVLTEEEINIESIDGRAVGELGIITLRTSDDDAALHALLKADLKAVTSDAIVFHLPDRPGSLAGVARLLSSHGLNVRTIHIVHRRAGHGIIAVTTDRDDLAISLLDGESLL